MSYPPSRIGVGNNRIKPLEFLEDGRSVCGAGRLLYWILQLDGLLIFVLRPYTFSLDVMSNGIENVFSSMLFDILSKHLFGCTQVAGKLDIMP